MKKKNPGLIFWFPTLLCLPILFSTTPAWAVQAHGGAEGLVSHQIGHILFFAGMLALLIRQYRRELTGPGWQEFRIFLCLIILWNSLTFCGHWMREVLDMDKLIKVNGHTIGFKASTTSDVLFYLTRLDHLFLVPAFFFLLMALKRWDQSS